MSFITFIQYLVFLVNFNIRKAHPASVYHYVGAVEAVLQNFIILVEWMNRFSMGGTRMIEIKSNAETAQELAATLTASGDTLSGVAAATKDEKTILAGNDAAHQAIDIASTKAGEIAAAIEAIGTNLQSVATGFTIVDEANSARIY